MYWLEISELIGGLRPFELQLVGLIDELRAKRLPQKPLLQRLSDSDSFRLPQEVTV